MYVISHRSCYTVGLALSQHRLDLTAHWQMPTEWVET